MTAPSWGHIANAANGTGTPPEQLAARFEVPVGQVVPKLEQLGCRRCPNCGWWSRTPGPDGTCGDKYCPGATHG